MTNHKKFENSLMSYLSKADLDQTLLKRSSSLISEMRDKGFILERIWKYGQPPADMLIASTRIKINEFNKVQEFLQNPLVRGLEVFPLGIINPEFFNIQFKLGREVETLRH